MKKNNILVTGASGQLGTQIKKIAKQFEKFNFFFCSKDELDISNYILVKKTIRELNINYLINCAAFTDVRLAEEKRKLAESVNSFAVKNIAKICFEHDVKLVHISTDYVFDGKKKSGYLENDIANPINFYGLSKLNGEKNILKYNLKKSIIIRTSWLYSESNNNFVSKIFSKINSNQDFSVVNGEFGSPTNAMDLALDIMKILPRLSNNSTEIYHYCNDGICSRYDLANEINLILNGKSNIISANVNDCSVKRPKFSALNNSKIKKNYQLNIKKWRDSLTDHFNSLGLINYNINEI